VTRHEVQHDVRRSKIINLDALNELILTRLFGMVWIGRIVKGRYQAPDITTFVDGLAFLIGIAIRSQVNGFPADGTIEDLGRGIHLNTSRAGGRSVRLKNSCSSYLTGAAVCDHR
jgi:hypothetical protein